MLKLMICGLCQESFPREAHSDSVHFQTELGIKALGEKVVECLIKNLGVSQ